MQECTLLCFGRMIRPCKDLSCLTAGSGQYPLSLAHSCLLQQCSAVGLLDLASEQHLEEVRVSDGYRAVDF